MRKHLLTGWLQYFIAGVWVINGLICKVMNLVPRHQEIVAAILSAEYSRILTISIGFAEIGIAAWILSGIKKRLNVFIQILTVATMNCLEFLLVPDLLLWGRANAFFALLFIVLIYYSTFSTTRNLTKPLTCSNF